MNASEYRKYVRGKSVALVCPAASIEGRGYGPEIDSFDLVVRTSCFTTRMRRIQHDIGSRADILYMAPIHASRGRVDRRDLRRCGVSWVVSCYGLRGRFARHVAEVWRACGSAAKFTFVDDSFVLGGIMRHMSMYPYTGVIAAAHIASLQPSRFKIFGMDFGSSFYCAGYRRGGPGMAGWKKKLKDEKYHASDEIQLSFLSRLFRSNGSMDVDDVLAGLLTGEYASLKLPEPVVLCPKDRVSKEIIMARRKKKTEEKEDVQVDSAADTGAAIPPPWEGAADDDVQDIIDKDKPTVSATAADEEPAAEEPVAEEPKEEVKPGFYPPPSPREILEKKEEEEKGSSPTKLIRIINGKRHVIDLKEVERRAKKYGK